MESSSSHSGEHTEDRRLCYRIIRMPERGTLVLLGDNGSGKSTILNLVAGLMTPGAGHIHIGHETFIDTASGPAFPQNPVTPVCLPGLCPLPAYDRI